MNGEGTPDLIIGAPGAGTAGEGAVYVIYGNTSAVTGDYTGAGIAGLPDLNGDGRGEILLGAPKANIDAAGAGGG